MDFQIAIPPMPITSRTPVPGSGAAVLGMIEPAKQLIAASRSQNDAGLLQVLVDPEALRLDKWRLLEAVRAELSMR